MIPLRMPRIVMCCVAALVTGCAPDNGTEVDLDAEAQAIRDLDVALSNAAQSRDADAYSQFFAEDVVQMPPNSPPLHGRGAIHEAASGLLGAGADLRFETTDVRVASSGDMAFSRGKYFLTLETPGGVIQDEGSYLEVWEKIEGVWKMTADMYNTDLPPEGSETGNGT